MSLKELVLMSVSNISVTIVLLPFVSLTVVRFFFYIVSETEIVSNIGNKKCVPAENQSKKGVNRDGDCYEGEFHVLQDLWQIKEI
jgi:hypothetical protein